MPLFLSCRFAHPAAYWNHSPNLAPKPVSFPSVSQHIYTITRPETWLLSPQFLTSSQSLLNVPPHFSNQFSSPLLIQSLSSDQYLSHLAYHSVSSPASPQCSHKHLSVDATQVRPLPWLKSFNDSLFGGMGKTKCKDLVTSLAYLSSLTLHRPLLELLPLTTTRYIQFLNAELALHSFS